MAESQIAGLFMTPEMYRQQQMQADRMRAMEYARLAPEERAAMGFFSAGQGLGRAAGTLLGAQDPQLQRITEQQQLLQGLDVADPDSLMEAARRASQTGNVPLAMQLAGRAQEVAQGLATTQKAQLSLAQERQLRAELASLPADATDEQRIAILSKYGPPGQMLQALTTQIGRRENIASREAEAERNREARRQDLELRIASEERIARERGATQQEIAQLRIDAQRERDRLAAEFRAGRASEGGAANRPPPGYRATPEGNLEAIPGGPADPATQVTRLDARERANREKTFPKANAAIQQVESTASTLEGDLRRLANHPGLSGITGLIAGRTPAVTAAAREAQALFDKILARGQFNELSAMRAASPTGGALGNVSNVEGERLRQAFGALNQTQSTDSVKRELARIADETSAFKQRMRSAFDDTYDYRQQERGQQTAPAAAGRGAGAPGTPGNPIRLD
jgi:hypothetical protein